MNLETLQNIKIVENDHTLEILVMDQILDISLNALIAIRDLGNITIVVNEPIAASSLIGKLCGFKNYQIVLINKIPIKKYDLLLSNHFTDSIKNICAQIKIKYMCFFSKINRQQLESNYVEFEESCFKLRSSIVEDNKKALDSNKESQNKIIEEKKKEKEEEKIENEIIDNESENYEMIIKDVASSEMIYDNNGIKYINDVIPGMVSIIMIVSENNNKFAETLRALRAQNIESVEYIIIDNAAGFRNNVKPNIRYGEKMEEDFCISHAKELCSGEYMFVMNQNSDEINILEEIEKGKYETR